MHFGLFMMPLHPPHRAFAHGYRRDVDQIVLADRLGFPRVARLVSTAQRARRTAPGA